MIRSWVALCLCFFGIGAVQAQTVSGTNLGAIPDGFGAGPANYGASRDVLFAVGGSATVVTASVAFSASHPWVGDLKVRLIAPNGREHLLFERTGSTDAINGGSNANLSGANTYRFGDAFATNWWTAAAIGDVNIPSTDARTVIAGGPGVVNPPAVTSLNDAFLGAQVNGTWILRFEDGWVGDTGSVLTALLTLTSTGVTRTVTNLSDDGAGSLRQAMVGAQAGDRIVFDSALFNTPQTITLLTPLPTINSIRSIEGPGAHLLTVRRSDTAPDFAIFNIGGGRASITGMTISNGRDVGGGAGLDGFGGGIDSFDPLTLFDVHVTGNAATNGGGVVVSSANAHFSHCTFSGNRALGNGGAMQLENGTAPSRLVNVSVSGNTAVGSPGGILNINGVVEIANSTIAGNRASGGATSPGGVRTTSQGAGSSATTSLRNTLIAANSLPNLAATTESGGGASVVVSRGFNLASDNSVAILNQASDQNSVDPMLGPLARQGGNTPTHLLRGGSPAIDKGNRSGYPTDQRTLARAFDLASITNPSDGGDIGAVEMQAIVVSNILNLGAGTLRAAMDTANANGTGFDDIVFDNTVFNVARTIDLASALPDVASNMSMSGPGANLLDVHRAIGAPDFSIFNSPNEALQLALSGMTLSNGRDVNGAGQNGAGGGIESIGELTLSGVHLTGNRALVGGGVAVQADAQFNHSTFSLNSATFDGGGVLIQSETGSLVQISNSTISGNSVDAGVGGGIIHSSFADQAILEIVNSTFANNTAPGAGARSIFNETFGVGANATLILRNTILSSSSAPNLSGQARNGGNPPVFTSRGFNLASDDSSSFLNQASDQNSANAGLASLINNGGATPTHALLSTSQALDRGSNAGSGDLLDQRRGAFLRTIDLPATNAAGGDGTDVGAFEAQTTPQADLIFGNGFEGP